MHQAYIALDHFLSPVSTLTPGSGVVPDLNNKVNERKFREATLSLLNINTVMINYIMIDVNNSKHTLN